MWREPYNWKSVFLIAGKKFYALFIYKEMLDNQRVKKNLVLHKIIIYIIKLIYVFSFLFFYRELYGNKITTIQPFAFRGVIADLTLWVLFISCAFLLLKKKTSCMKPHYNLSVYIYVYFSWNLAYQLSCSL